ncbi:MAG: tetratricopeptide repeat protein [candidate division WOR-3 bacterium]|nr:tetratricopeptide repeat protein [candidate division WOR-3 bacterium]
MKSWRWIICLWLLGIVFNWAYSATPLDALLRGGRIHFQGGRYERAFQQFQSALNSYPGNPEARFWLALSLEKLGKSVESAENFDTCFIDARDYVDKMLKDNNIQYTVFNAFTRAGNIMNQKGNYDLAIKYFTRATESDPKNIQGYLQLAQIYSTVDSVAKIKGIADKLFQLDSLNPQINVILGKYFFKKQDWDSSLFYYEKSVKQFTNSLNKAKDLLSTELKIDSPKTETVLIKLSELRGTKQLESYIAESLKAKPKMTKLAGMSNEIYLIINLLSSSYFYAGSSALQKANTFTTETQQKQYLSLASNYFNEVLRYNPLDYDALFNLGFTQYRSGADTEAEKIFSSITQLALLPLSSLKESLARSLIAGVDDMKKGYWEIKTELIKDVEQELDKRKTFKTGYWYLYFPSLKNTTPAELASNLSKVFVSGLDPVAVEELMLFYGAVQTNLKKYDSAIVSFNTVLALNPKNQSAYRNLAVCYREKGEQKKAYEILQEGERIKKQP